MEEIEYNVLWIDDEHEELGGTKGRAKMNGINLVPFKSLDGIDELERNFSIYDAVLLDAKFYESETDVSSSEDTYNVHRAKERILQIPKKFDVFVLTGQAEAYDDDTFNKAFLKVYHKGSDEDTEQLFADIKESASKQIDTQLRHKHKRVFDVCKERYIGELAALDLLSLLKSEDKSEVSDSFNAIRKIIEDLFVAFNKYGLLPIEFVSPNVSINPSKKFLTGKDENGNYYEEKGYKHLDDTHLPLLIAKELHSILDDTQAGSHRSDIDEYIKEMQTPYVVNSLINQLMNILMWFKAYVDSNPSQGNWELVGSRSEPGENPILTGTVINYNPQRGGYAFFRPDNNGDNAFIPPHIFSNGGLSEGSEIEVEIETVTNIRTGQQQKRVKRVMRLIS